MQLIQAFLRRHRPTRPLLVAFSGGPDSMALLHLLLEQKIPLALAHVDHRWRPESSRQAEELAQMAQQLGIPFHLKTLDPPQGPNSAEAASRQERIAFFIQLCRAHQYEAVVLGHHGDDQAETVLKRVFEGASLPHLGGLQEVSTIEGVSFWRPLLSLSKQQLLDYLSSHNLDSIDDPSNTSSKYLRGRMRTSLLPLLSEQFGKQVSPSLCRLATEAHLLRDYLDRRVTLPAAISGPFGTLYDLSALFPSEPLEQRYLVRRLLDPLAPSSSLIETLCHHLTRNSANIRLHNLYIDRRRLFILQNLSATYRVTIDQGPVTPACDWRAVWSGRVQLPIPATVELAKPSASLHRHWTNHKVPALLRPLAPCLLHQGRLYCDLLTGRVPREPATHRLTLEWSS
jgi:tRNA(Ile)-lysidine synthase